jgi:transketolase
MGSRRKMEETKKLEKKAETIRRHVLNMIYEAGSGHPGGSLSCVDILTALYFHTLQHNSKDPDWADLDRFILSQGHAAPTLDLLRYKII